MLNPFPSLFNYTFFAPTLLRVAAAVFFLWSAFYHARRRRTVASVRFPVVGGGLWIPILSALIEGAIGLALLFGYDTQIAASVGALLALKYAFWDEAPYQPWVPLSRGTSMLLAVVCLSLLLTGAGAFAFDVRL